MDETEPKGKSFNYFITAIKTEDGLWKVDERVVHGKSFDLVNWDNREISVSAIDPDIDAALAHAQFSLAQYLSSVDFDLFNGDAVQLGNGTELVQ